MNSPLRYVSFRLFLILMAGMLIVFSIHTYLDIRTTSSNLTQAVEESALQASDLIVRSTRYSMLLNRKEDVHETIRTLGSEPGFVGISVYNKDGEIIFSTDSLAMGHKVDLDAEACNICHASGEPLVSVPADSRARVYEIGGERVLGLINPIPNEPACYNGACHAHSSAQKVLGVLDVKMSLNAVDHQVANVRRGMIISSILMTIIVAGLSGMFIHRVIRKPIRRLARAMATVSRGDLDTKVDGGTSDEFGRLARAFNRMGDELKKARDELQQWATTLEERVDAKSEELQRAQTQVIHMEKMASLGKLSASVAHEINNPLFGILTYSKLGLRELDGGGCNTDKLREYLTVVQRESSRCGDIVKNLLDFARASGGHFERVRLNEIVDQVITLLAHHFEMRQIEVHKELMWEGDDLTCDARQIQQALIAPCINAVEAMLDGGELTIRTRGDKETLSVAISDNGPGIPDDVLHHVFEPFYTTKEGQGGLGLGLAVVYGIVKRHSGEVNIASTAEGTTVTIVLPRDPAPAEEGSPVQSNSSVEIVGENDNVRK